MFTGIIQAVGTVLGVETTPRSHGTGGRAHRLDLELGALATDLARGASVAVNGVCLTLAERHGTAGGFDVVPETWRRTTLRHLRRPEPVNLERALRASDAIDGHFVQGHIDGTGVVERVDRSAGECKLWVRSDPELMPYIIPQGSVALDGTSLTIVDVEATRFSVALIPTTLELTVLGRRNPGDPLNIETDILARLVVRRLAALTASPGAGSAGGLTLEKLQEGGFAR